MKTETRQYKDVSGNPCTLDWLVKNEPEWAANQIRHRDKLEAEITDLKTKLKYAIAMRPASPVTDNPTEDDFYENAERELQIKYAKQDRNAIQDIKP